MADLDGLADAERRAVDGAAFAFDHVADVGNQGRLEVARRSHIAKVVVLLVGTGDQVRAALEALSRITSRPRLLRMRELPRRQSGRDIPQEP